MAIKRNEVKLDDKWDLSSLCKDYEEWATRFKAFETGLLTQSGTFKGKLGDKATLFQAFNYLEEANKELEVIHSYAFLNYETNGSDSTNQSMVSQSGNLVSKFYASIAYFDSELLEQSEGYLEDFIKDEKAKNYKVYVQKLLDVKPHMLSEKEERLLALSSQPLSVPHKAFQTLNNVDFKFEPVFGEELTHATYQTFLLSDKEEVRREAYKNYYKSYLSHENTLADLYQGSINKDIFIAQARNFNSSLETALDPDKVPLSVYKSLIEVVNESLPILHRYYALLAKKLKKDKIKHYDVYLPLCDNIEFNISYDEAITLIKNSITCLGEEYSNTLIKGLTSEHWVDRYENVGKSSGAFSAGCYTGKPYILTNYNPKLVRSVSTLIHEGGHSMHSYYSKNNNPILSYDYTIFEAEVASTFNEELLSTYMIANAKTKEEKAYLISSKLSNIVATLFRQTMFAEFEMIVHEKVEHGEMATLSMLRGEYRKLLTKYFGPQVELEEYSDLEGLRIPHFYSAFYVYKYATGVSAAIALSQKVLNGTEKDRDAYLAFLKSGGSKYPIEALKGAGVDMSNPEVVRQAVAYFSRLLDLAEAL